MLSRFSINIYYQFSPNRDYKTFYDFSHKNAQRQIRSRSTTRLNFFSDKQKNHKQTSQTSSSNNCPFLQIFNLDRIYDAFSRHECFSHDSIFKSYLMHITTRYFRSKKNTTHAIYCNFLRIRAVLTAKKVPMKKQYFYNNKRDLEIFIVIKNCDHRQEQHAVEK